MDDVDNALNSGAELLARWAATPDAGLIARDRKTLEKAAETMADQTLSAEDRLAAGDNPTIAALHETHPLRDGISPSQPQRFKVERPKSSFAVGTSSSHVPKAPPSIRTPARSFRVR